MVLSLGLVDNIKPEEPCFARERQGGTAPPPDAEPKPETPEPPPWPDQISSLDEAFRQLELSEPDAPDQELLLPGAEDVLCQRVPDSVAEATAYWLRRYDANQTDATMNVRQLAAKSHTEVVDALLRLCEEGLWGNAAPFLARLLSNDSRVTAKLSDPAIPLERSVCVATVLREHEPGFDVAFARSLLVKGHLSEAARHRGLVILERLGGGDRLVSILVQFMRDPNSRIRSKAARMFGQVMSKQSIMDRLMADEDARVRANFVEGLWNRPDADSRAVFRRALEDPDHRVVGNAVAGLHRLGEARAVVAHVGKMARRPEPLFRAAAAWVMGQTGEHRYSAILRQMVRDPDPLVRSNALRSLRRINQTEAGATC